MIPLQQFPVRLLIFIALLSGALASAHADTLLWQLGKADNASAEFSDYRAAPDSLAVPADWRTRTDWTLVPKGLKGDAGPALSLTYTLPVLPLHGVLLSFKTLDADKVIPQCAVFSNGLMAGLVQIGGVGRMGSAYPFKETYRLYIPREMLQQGRNTLRLTVDRGLYAGAAGDQFSWWQWDYLRLEALDRPAAEPLHGRYVHLGSNLEFGQFRLDKNTIRHAPVLKWLGIAYSGNVMRAAMWVDIPGEWKPDGLAYLKTLRDYNMQVVVDHVGSHFPLAPDGSLLPSTQADLAGFLTAYGSLVQFYELENEPGLFHGVKERELALANWLRAHRAQYGAAHMKLVAPGWTYWPKTWESEAGQRAQVEAVTELTNGHSYGQSYAGGFLEQLKLFGPLESGWPKEWLNTETGANDGHTDWPETASTQPHASICDRILRAHIGMASHFMYHTIFFPEEGLALLDFHFDPATHDVAASKVYPGVNGEDPRLKTYRRLALAYATHGAPLPYTVLNRADVTDKKVLFRAVNTATLAPLPGSGGRSDKVLLNFINFETVPQTLRVRVQMPRGGKYIGERFGPGETYAAARRAVNLQTAPTLDLSETLGPGEAVQYILSPPKATK